tara:strand:+ start:108 stop:443 length:336 start_codon:yes stop_codon:yes gene_type:complete
MALNTNLLIDQVNVERITTSGVDDRGNPSNTWSTLYTNANCRLIKNGSVEDRDGRNTIIEGITIYFDDQVTIKANDRIKDGTKYYEITGITAQRDAKGEDCYTVASCLYRE